MANDPNANQISDFLRSVALGTENVLQVVRDLTNDSDHVTVALQNRELLPEALPEPQRSESPPRNHVFYDVAAAAEYLTLYGGQGTVILADMDGGRMDIVLDEASERGREQLLIKPLPHPLFAEWQATVFDRVMEVNAFAQFVMRHRRYVIEPDGRELALLFSQVTAATSITVNRGGGKKSVNGVLVETTISGNKRNEPVDLPDSITILVPLFVGSDPVELEVDLLVSARDAETIVVYGSAGGAAEARMAAMQQMLDELKESLPNAVIGLGSAQYDEWQYLPQPKAT